MTTKIKESSINKLEDTKKDKKFTWMGLGMMAFSCVWGFGNVVNGFGYFGGTGVIIPWILVFLFYFLPYSLIVGELGSVFKKHGGGVSSWIFKTIGPKTAFFCGWIYWVVHLPYISQKPNSTIVSLSWIIFQDDRIKNIDVIWLQLIGLVVFLVAVFLSTRGLSVIKSIAGIAGTSMLILSLLYILLVWTAPAITGTQLGTIEFNIESFIPKDPSIFLSLSILVFAVGGCEKISPYVNQLRKPGKDFPLGMIFLAIMVMVCAFLGTLAMGMMYDSNMMYDSSYNKWFIGQGQYDAFAQLGNYYGVGNILLILYAASNAIGQFGVLIISIDAPLRIMLSNSDKKFIPKWWFKTNKNGSYTNGLKVVILIVSILILIPCMGISDVNALIKWLVKLNSVCMPLRYLFVFMAYIALKKSIEKFNKSEYTFIKNKTFGILVGGWCFLVTSVCCLVGMYDQDVFQMFMNIVTPLVLLGIGLLLPLAAKRKQNKITTKDIK